MPFIDSKVTVELTEEKKTILKSKLGKAVSVMNKGESFLMVGFNDNYDLYFGGNKLEKGAFVDIRVFGTPSAENCEKMTAEVCHIYKEELEIPEDNVYVTYQGYSNWGWNSKNF